MKERLMILTQTKKDPTKVINSSNELYGACRHKPRFHRYPETTTPSVLMTNRSSERVKPGITVGTPPVMPDRKMSLCIYIPHTPTEAELNTSADPDEILPVTNGQNYNMETNSNFCHMDV